MTFLQVPRPDGSHFLISEKPVVILGIAHGEEGWQIKFGRFQANIPSGADGHPLFDLMGFIQTGKSVHLCFEKDDTKTVRGILMPGHLNTLALRRN